MGFDSKKYETNISVESIDELFERWSFQNVLKIIVIYFLTKARKNLVEADMMIEKREYEIAQAKANKKEIANEDKGSI